MRKSIPKGLYAISVYNLGLEQHACWCDSMKKNSLAQQWDDAAETWVDFVRTHKDYDREDLNNPAIFEMLCDIRGKRILDLGCGEGYNSRIMAKKAQKLAA